MYESAKTVLIIGKVWPESTSSAAGSRMLQLMDIFTEYGFEVHFASAATKNEISDNLSDRVVATHEIRLNDSSFDTFIRKLNPTVVVFDRFMTEEQYGWRVAEQCPKAIRILDSEDLHSLRYTRQKQFIEGEPFQPEFMYREEITKRELASIYRSDITLIISSYEMDLLQKYFHLEENSLHYLPFLYAPINDDYISAWPDYEDRNGFIMIGNYLHEPNRDAIVWLKDRIWPLIRLKLPTCELRVYGSYISQNGFQMNNREEGFHVCGRAENLEKVITLARVMLAPLRFGAGLKGKLFDSMIYGTPSVTTTIGIEGISKAIHWCGEVAEEEELFANAAVELYLNKSKWCEAQNRGVKMINSKFQMSDHVRPFIKKVNDLIENIEAYREKRFICSMLMHHTMASSKYMSKWIEEKGKSRKDINQSGRYSELK